MSYKGPIEDFVVITGFSGAGKSQAMATFEDAGYFCVDNLPPGMIGSLAELFGHEGSKVERAAVASDVRGGEYFDGLVKVLDDLDRRGVPYRLLYLEAADHPRRQVVDAEVTAVLEGGDRLRLAGPGVAGDHDQIDVLAFCHG